MTPRTKLLSVILFLIGAIAATPVNAQRAAVQPSSWSVGLDVGMRSTLSTISFKGTLYSDPPDPRLDEWWSDPSGPTQFEAAPAFSMGAHIRHRVAGEGQDVKVGIGLAVRYHALEYAYRDWNYSGSDYMRTYDLFEITAVDVVPELRVDAGLTSRLDVFAGLGVGLALLSMNEHHESDNYDTDNNRPWGALTYDADASTTQLLVSPSLGLVFGISDRVSAYASYDIQLMGTAKFSLKKIERRGSDGGISWTYVRYDRERHFRLSNSSFRVGVELGL